jgi:hypothetical protein
MDPGSGAFLSPGSGIRIRDGAMVGSGIKHPGSATLVPSIISDDFKFFLIHQHLVARLERKIYRYNLI